MGGTKRINKLWLWLYRSASFKAGKNISNLDQVQTRDAGDAMDAPTPLFTGIKEISWDGGHQAITSVLIRQDAPLPMILMAARPRLEAEAK